MKTFTKTAAAFGLISAILAGPAAEEAQAEPITTVFVTVGAAGGAWIGGTLGAKMGIAAGGGAAVATVPMAAIGAGAGAMVMDAAAKVAGPALAALGPKTPVAVVPLPPSPRTSA